MDEGDCFCNSLRVISCCCCRRGWQPQTQKLWSWLMPCRAAGATSSARQTWMRFAPTAHARPARRPQRPLPNRSAAAGNLIWILISTSHCIESICGSSSVRSTSQVDRHGLMMCPSLDSLAEVGNAISLCAFEPEDCQEISTDIGVHNIFGSIAGVGA